MNIFLKSLATIFITSLLCLPLSAYETTYSLPNNISLSLSKSLDSDEDRLIISGNIKCKLGSLKNLKVLFECSKDYKIHISKTTIDELHQNKARNLRIQAFRTGENPGLLGSWVKMSVQYLPDYKKISKIVTSKKYYPDTTERLKLIDAFNANKTISYRMTEASRLFLSKRRNK